MGLFLKNKTQKEEIWANLNSTEELQQALDSNLGNAKVFFKHSTRCGTSIMAIKSFENSWTPNPSTELYYIDVLRQRAVSDELAMRTGVRHESPQVIVLRNDELIYHNSHGDISVREITKLL